MFNIVNGKQHTILVVDDEALLRQLLKDQLEGAGFSVVTATNGIEALTCLSQAHISLAIVDLIMPGMDGIEFCQSVRSSAQFRDLPVIFLTGRAELGTDLNPFQLGADDYLRKPVDPAELVNRIHSVIIKREAYRRLVTQSVNTETLLEITRSINSSLETEDILKQVVQRVAVLLDDVFRCSIVFIRKESHIGHVVATSDSQAYMPLKIELDKYPEIREAMTTGRPVIIEDVEKSPLLKPVLDQLISKAFNTIFVLPVIYKTETLGVMLVNALRSTPGVTAEEIRFCELVAEVSANALQHAASFKTVQEETEALKDSHSRLEHELSIKAIYELLFENTSEGLFAIDSEHKILYVNRRALEITGHSRDDLQKIPFTSLLDQESEEKFLLNLASQKTGKTGTQVFDAVLKSNEEAKQIISVSIGKKPPGNDLQVLSFRDVTQRREIEKQLREARSQLEEANHRLVDLSKARTEFYNTAAHELRSPVAVVNGYCELLSLSGRDNLTDKQKDYLDQLARSGDRLIDLIHNLLDLSRFEVGKMPVEIEENDLSDLIREVGNEVRSLIDTNGLTIEVHSGPLTMIYYDSMLIRRVLVNLISNAVKYTPEGGRVSVVLEEDNTEVRVRVSDTGEGISERDQDSLFKEFSQLSTDSGSGGTGLGLTISKKIIEAHEGEIWVESSPGEGSHFTFSLPKSLTPKG